MRRTGEYYAELSTRVVFRGERGQLHREFGAIRMKALINDTSSCLNTMRTMVTDALHIIGLELASIGLNGCFNVFEVLYN